jgi:hypothetical protein
MLAEARHHALQHKVDAGIVSGQAEGAVAAIVSGDLVQVPESSLKSVEEETLSVSNV